MIPCGLRGDRRRCQVEHRTTVIGVVQLALTACDVDPVGYKEVRTQQHIDLAKVAEAQPGVTDLLIADLQARKCSDPGIYPSATHPSIVPSRLHTGVAWFDPSLCSCTQSHDR